MRSLISMNPAVTIRSILLASTVAIFAMSAATAQDIKYKITGPFDATQLPAISDADRDKIVALANDYDKRPSMIVAVSEDGTAETFWGMNWDVASRVRNTMQRCEHISKKTCGLAVVDGNMVEFKFLPRTLTYHTRFNPKEVPFINIRQTSALFSYVNAQRNKALAINWNGAYGYWHGDYNSQRARKNALTECRKISRRWGHCFLYAVNDKVVFTAETDIYGDR